MIGLENFTEGRSYQIQGGIFMLVGISDSTLIFTTTRDDHSRVTVTTLRKEVKALLTRLSIEEKCGASKLPCNHQGCGECHPENFE